MKKILLLSLTCLSISAMAQITITSSDLPEAGKKYFRSQPSNASIIDESETGANHTWDYTELQRDSRDTLIYQKVSNTPIFYQFLFNNPLSPSYMATEGRWSEDVNLGGFITMSDNYLFSKQTSSDWTEVGIGTTISGVPLPTQYSDIKTKLKLPLNYQDFNTDDYSYLIQIPTIGVSGQDGTLTYEVDGWGTIKLPGGTYDAIRVKTELNKSDTIYLDALNFGLKIPSSEVIYEWYAKGEGFPVLTVTKSLFGAVTTVLYSDDLISGINNSLAVGLNKLYPNPATNMLNLDLVSNNLSVTVLDVSGSVVLQPNELSPSQIDVSMLPKGMYFVKIENQESQEILRFVKQ